DYQANIGISGSPILADSKTIPVRLHVTADPIAVLSSQSASFRIAQGNVTQVQFVAFGNLGQGTLALSQVTGSPGWLTTKIQGTLLQLTADASGLSPGSYTGTIAVASNAKNGPTNIPVQLTVLATGAPSIAYQGVVDNALFKLGDPVAPGGIAAVFGDQ